MRQLFQLIESPGKNITISSGARFPLTELATLQKPKGQYKGLLGSGIDDLLEMAVGQK